MLPLPVPFGNNGLRFIPFFPRLSPRALRAGNPRRRGGMKLRQGGALYAYPPARRRRDCRGAGTT